MLSMYSNTNTPRKWVANVRNYVHTHFMVAIENTSAKKMGAAVKAEAARRGLSVASLAAVLGLSKPSVYRRVNGDEPFDINELDVIARHFGIDLLTLITSAELDSRAVA